MKEVPFDTLSDVLKEYSSNIDYESIFKPYIEKNSISESQSNIREFEQTEKIPVYVFGICSGHFTSISEEEDVTK